MSRIASVSHKFVDAIPNKIEEGTLYVSIEYGMAVHKCCCGCGQEVVTPLGPTDWKVIFDGDSVSLYPSIGNWSFDCRSHYWIDRGRVQWSKQWSAAQIDRGRMRDRLAKQSQFGDTRHRHPVPRPARVSPPAQDAAPGMLQRIIRLFTNRS